MEQKINYQDGIDGYESLDNNEELFKFEDDTLPAGKDYVKNAIYLDLKNNKVFHQFSMFHDEDNQWSSNKPQEIPLDEYLRDHFRDEANRNIVRKMFEIKRPLNLTEAFEFLMPEVFEIIKDKKDLDIDEFAFHEEDGVKYSMGISYDVYRGYKVYFSSKDTHYTLLTEREYLIEKKEFEEEFAKEVKETNNFEGCEFFDVCEAFGNSPLKIEKECELQGIKHLLTYYHIGDGESEAIEYIKKHNIKITDPESMED